MYFDPDSVHTISEMMIGGELRQGTSIHPVASPSRPSLKHDIGWADATQVNDAVLAARNAFPEWSALPPRDRPKILYRFADLVDANAEEIARLESLVSARIYSESMARDVKVVSGVLRYFAEFSDKIEGSLSSTPSNSFSMTVHEPHGVVAAISPWNFPIILSSWKFAPALAAGNTVVLKPSELTPFSAVRIAQLGTEAGLPNGVFNVINGDGQVGGELVRHPDVDYVTFTGSSATGAQIMADAATTGLKPVSLELGGKGPQLVFEDAPDLDRLAAMVARGITYNSGQVCFAGSRLIVQRQLADDLTRRVADLMSELQVGPTWGDTTTMPPIINKKQNDRIAHIVEQSIRSGAELLCGGERVETAEGEFYKPTILNVSDIDNAAVCEEIFGPVLAVQTFDDFEEGVALANHSDYGLTASVHTRDISRAFKAAQDIQSGTVWINDWGRRTDFTAPFGGYKKSGLGKDMGRPGFEKYLKSKAIWLEID